MYLLKKKTNIQLMQISKNMKKVMLFSFALMMILIVSCGKDSEIFTPTESQFDISQWSNDVPLEPQVFNKSADNDILILTENGNVLEISQGILVDGNGNLVTGDIQLEIIEIQTLGKMVKYGKPTMTSSDYLSTDGEFYINATQNGKDLYIKDNKSFSFFVADDSPDGNMQLFYGAENDEGEVIWNDEPERQAMFINEWTYEVDSQIIIDFGYQLLPEKFEWINIDKYNDIPEEDKTSVCVELDTTLYTSRNTLVYFINKEEKVAVSLDYDKETGLFCEPYASVPKGWEITIIVISIQGEELYHFAIEQTTVVDNTLVSIVPTEKPIDEIKSILDSL